MRVLHFISSFGAGGAESLVRDLSIALTDRGIQVGIAAFSRGADQKSDENYEQEMRRELLKHGVNLYYLGHKSRNNVFVGISNFKKILREFKPDVVHIHIARALVLRFLSACNVATVYTHHSTIFNFPTALFQLFDMVTTTYIAISKLNHKVLERLTRRIVVTIPNAIDGSRFQCPVHKVPPALDIILSVGSILEAKDYDTLLTVAKIVKESLGARIEQTKFLIVGDGQRITEYREKVTLQSLDGLVEFVGARTDVPDLMKRSSILLMTSRIEGLPIVLIEALYAGLPVVCTDVGACREVLSEGVDGEFALAGDAAELAKKVLRLLTDKQLRRAYSDNARLSAQRFSISESAHAHLQVYTDAIKNWRQANTTGSITADRKERH